MKKYLGQGAAEKLARAAGLAPEDRDVVAYGLEYFLSLLLGTLLTLSAGWALGLLKETAAVLFGWGSVRLFAGGGHCTGLWRCAVASAAAVTGTACLARIIGTVNPPELWVAAAFAWTAFVILVWAPSNSARPVTDPERRRRLRRRALLTETILFTFFYFLASRAAYRPWVAAEAAGAAAAAFMITPAGFAVVGRIDAFLKRYLN